MNDNLLSVPHEQADAAVRAQLAAASLAAQVLQRRCTDPEDAEYLARIRLAAARGTQIIDRAALARRLADEDELRVVFGAVDLAACCREVCEAAEPLLLHSGVTLTFRTEEAALTTQADRELVEQLLFALLSGGAQAMPGGGALTLTLTKTPRSAVITVGDEGAGLSGEALERLFGGDAPTPDLTPGAGDGLGLPLARAIAESHGGLLVLDTAPGGGVRAAAALPLRDGRPPRLRDPGLPASLRERAVTALADALPTSVFLPGSN